MKFGLLGSLEVVDDHGRSVDLGGAQARSVLALLLAAPGQVVTADALVDAIWRESPPASAAGTLQSYISRLRRALEPERAKGQAASVLCSEPPGYRLAVDAEDVDYRRFEMLADRGRSLLMASEFEQAREVLTTAQRLWRGPALAEYRFHDFASGLITRLEDRRLAALEDRIAADLALGRHAAVIGELAELVAEHPLQETLRAQLALALYRSGRQADALRAIEDARRTLRVELGIMPGRALHDLEAAILAHDPAVETPAPPAAPGAADAAAVAPAASAAATVAAPPPPHATEAAPAPDGRPGAPPLVGRVQELAQLQAVLDEARSATRTVIVEGEPGIGKTRLVEELAALASARGTTVLWGRAFEGGATPAFWPWLPPLRNLAEHARADGSTLGEIDQLLAPAATPAQGPSDASHYALVDAVVELLRSRASLTPTVIVLDDLHWADVSSLELLTSITARLADVRLLVVVTVRELDVGRNDQLVDTLAALTRRTGTRRIQLRGRLPDDTVKLVVQTIGEADPSLLTHIHGRAEGNPFYITELARLLATGDMTDVPSGVRDVVRRRLAQLPAESSNLLQLAAVIGRSFDLDLLARAAKSDLDTCLDHLEPAVVQRLVAAVPDLQIGFRFAHALVREVVVDGMSALARARLHLTVADALEDTDDTAEIRAEHLWNAAPIGAGRRAADGLERAAHVAIRRRSLSAAEHLLERAVPLRRSTSSSDADREAELRTIELLISVMGARRGQAALIDSPLLGRAKQLATETGRDQRLQSLLWVEWAGLDQACLLDKADPIAAELLERAERSDSSLDKVIGHEAWGIHLWHHGDIAEAAAHFDAAVEGGSHLPPEERSALLEPDQLRLPQPFAIYVHDLMGDLDDADARFEATVRLMPDDPYWELLVRNFATWSAVATGAAERAERQARRAVEVDPEGLSTFWSMQVRCYLGAALCQQGRLDEGLPLIERAWEAYTAVGLRVNGGTYFGESALALAKAGRVDEAAAALTMADEVSAADSEHYADAVILVAQAAVALAHGGSSDSVAALVAEAHERASKQGAMAIAARVEREAAALGVAINR